MKKLNRFPIKLLAAVLSVVMICSVVGVAAYSAGADSSVKKADTAAVSDEDTSSESSTEDGTLSKDETVYVIADAEGQAKKVVVSDWIKNPDKLKSIKDKSSLIKIKNVKGDEKYTMDKDNMCIWDAQGNDIYYQGEGEDALPVDLSVSYTLDGESISPKELAGKSGRVKIRFDYDNKKFEKVTVNGKEETIYVPFVMLTGMILDNDKFSNVHVSNGKVINDGNRTIVAGFAMPGLEDSLQLDSDKLDLPSYVEFTADAKDFELSTTLTIATNDVFNDIDFTDADEELDELDKKLDKLTDATDKLIDGSSQLYKGISTLLDKSGELVSGVKTLAAGAKKLASGAGALDKGAGKLNKGAKALKNGAVTLKSGTEQLKNGIAQLADGLDTLSSNSPTLNSGAKQVFDTLLKTADSSIAAAGLTADKLTIENYSKVLSGIENSLGEDSVKKLAYNTALETVTSTVRAQESMIKAQVEGAVKQNVLEAVLKKAGMDMTAEQYTTACAAGMVTEEVQQQINGAVDAQMQTDDIKSTVTQQTEAQIKKLIDDNMKSDQVQTQINEAVEKAKSGKTAITTLKTQLDSYNKFYQGVLSYTAGVDKAKSGASQLVSGSSQLDNGTKKLKKGTKDLKKGTKELKNGTAQLKNGAEQLSGGLEKLSKGTGVLIKGVEKLKNGSLSLNKGLKQYKQEGVDKLVDAVNGDVKTLVERLKAISKVSSRYKSYSGLGEDMDGEVNFIYKTDSIETD